jgi:hypothetical protein
MAKVIHVIGNGPLGAPLYNKAPRKGLKLGCNVLPFAVDNVYGTVIADFKMMKAITAGELTVPGDWILGFRPKLWTERTTGFLMKFGIQIKEFYLTLPEYAPTYTDFNCGHLAVHYACNKLKGTEVHMYGFDSIFEFDMRSTTDFVLESDRGSQNTLRLADNWRPIWTQMFNEFPEIDFKLHHNHNNIRIPVPDNVEIIVGQ